MLVGKLGEYTYLLIFWNIPFCYSQVNIFNPALFLLVFSLNRILRFILLRSRYRAPDPVFWPDPHPWQCPVPLFFDHVGQIVFAADTLCFHARRVTQPPHSHQHLVVLLKKLWFDSSGAFLNYLCILSHLLTLSSPYIRLHSTHSRDCSQTIGTPRGHVCSHIPIVYQPANYVPLRVRRK